MDVNKMMLIMLLTPLTIFGALSLIWFGVDRWQSWKAGRKMRGKHIHHIVLGLWPLLCAYIGIQFIGKIPLLVSSLLVILTAALYFFASLWDIRYESIHEYTQSEPSALLYRMIKTYPLIIMCVSYIVMLGGIIFLIVTLLNLSADLKSLSGFLFLGCLYLTFHILFNKVMPSWERQAERGKSTSQ